MLLLSFTQSMRCCILRRCCTMHFNNLRLVCTTEHHASTKYGKPKAILRRSAIRNLVVYKSQLRRSISQASAAVQVALYCDLHGHSRKHGTFMYGCEQAPSPQVSHHSMKGEGKPALQALLSSPSCVLQTQCPTDTVSYRHSVLQSHSVQTHSVQTHSVLQS